MNIGCFQFVCMLFKGGWLLWLCLRFEAFGLTFVWWYLPFRKSEETPAGSQWGEALHLYALSESLQWPWSSAAAWTHPHRFARDIHTHCGIWRQHTQILSTPSSHGDNVTRVSQERSPASVWFAARPSPRPAHSSLTYASTLERSPTCAIAVAKGQQADKSVL